MDEEKRFTAFKIKFSRLSKSEPERPFWLPGEYHFDEDEPKTEAEFLAEQCLLDWRVIEVKGVEQETTE